MKFTPAYIQSCFAIAIMIIAVSCKTDFEDIKYNNGNADLSRVVAVGGSHLAGYMDRALYREAQSNSIPAILSTRFSFVDGGPIIQPLVNSGVGIGIYGNAKYELRNIADPCKATMIVLPQPVAASGDLNIYNPIGGLLLYNNVAVPNTRIGDLTRQSFGDPSPFLGNPLYARFASQPGTSTISGDALLINPTFVIVWIGMEDIFNYARSGGIEGGDSITALSVFSSKYTNLINELTSLNAKGVVMNIPELATMPFFTEFAYNDLQLTAAEAADLNALYAVVDPSISFVAGANPYVIEDPSKTTGRRTIVPGEYILMNVSRDSINCQGWGTIVPIDERYVLDADEVALINSAISSFNSIITTSAASNGLAVCNMNAFYKTFNNEILLNGVNFSGEYIYGGIFSTDGYHPSQRGNALLANEIISTINSYYSSKIPLADVNAFSGIIIP